MNPWLRQGFLLFLLAVLGGCGEDPPKEEPPPPPPTKVVIKLHAGDDINPTQFGRPSPLVLRLYELKNADAFAGADFYKLYDQEDAVLKADLLARQELLIRPAQTLEIERTTEPDTRFIGLLAAFQDLDHAIWREILAIPLHRRTIFEVQLDKLSIKAKAAPDKHR